MLATLDRAVFVERVSVDTPANVRKAKKAIKKAFEVQLEGKGFVISRSIINLPNKLGINTSRFITMVKR